MARVIIEEKIPYLIEDSVKSLFDRFPDAKRPENLKIQLDIPKDMSHGDLTSNVALRLAKPLKMKPMVIAHELAGSIQNHLNQANMSSLVEDIYIANPGFINIKFSKSFLFDNLLKGNELAERYGSGARRKEKVQIEFVSANPTGPLTVAHGRQAAIGDALGNILEFYGYYVKREYFVNDEGRQIELLGESILHHYLSLHGISVAFPDNGYRGDYIRDIAVEISQKFKDKYVKDHKKAAIFFSEFGHKHILQNIKTTLMAFGVNFDSWFSQRKLTKEIINGVLERLREQNFVYDKDGASWFRSTAFGDEKDRVVIKSNGSFTYFAPDIAYHMEKYKRGFDRIINMWGPDHHGYIPRLKASVEALGYARDSISVLLVQLATLYRDGKVLSMSTRKGEFLTLDEVSAEVGRDVTKFFFLMRKLDSHLDFDLEIAKRQSADNPVFYIQYAHARIWSIIAFGKKVRQKLLFKKLDLTLLTKPEELALTRLIYQFPSYVRDSADNLEPYYIIVYLNNLATVFHNFYTKHKVITDDLSLSKARLFLVDCVRICLANGLRLLGISLPKKM